MALIKCKECGGEVSNKADACPKCGAKVPKSGIVGTGCLIVVVAFALFAFFGMATTPNSPSGGTNPSSGGSADSPLTAAEILDSLPSLGADYAISKAAFACKDQDYVKRISSAANENDSDAATRGIADGINAGTCIYMTPGERFTVEDVSVWSSLVQIRPAGDLDTYWMYADRVDLKSKNDNQSGDTLPTESTRSLPSEVPSTPVPAVPYASPPTEAGSPPVQGSSSGANPPPTAPKTYKNGDLITLRGFAFAPSSENGTIWVLVPIAPIWVDHTPGSSDEPQVSEVREIQIIGSAPPLGVELELRGILSTHGELPAADGSTAIRVISGRRIQ